MMKTRTILLTIALAAASATSLASAAPIGNPENDSAAFFRYKAWPTAAKLLTGAPAAGDVSDDGRYVYVGSDRGWVLREHSFAVVGGELAHTADCVPYNMPKPAVAGVAGNVQSGIFGDHYR